MQRNLKRFLHSKANENVRMALVCIHEYQRTHISGDIQRGIYHLQVALAFARQLPSTPHYRMLRAHIIQTLQAARKARP